MCPWLTPRTFLECPPCVTCSFTWATCLFIALPLALFTTSLNTSIIIEWTFLPMKSLHISFPIILDPTGLVFAFVVLFIAANIFQYTAFYMSCDHLLDRFTTLVLLFVISMNLLIFIPHLIFLLIGWDGLGITSFILVIYYQNPKSLAAGMITVLTNRIGDVLILLSIAWSFNQGNWLALSTQSSTNLSSLLLASLTIAAMTKSAQMPFSSWLPAAMAAPTPVSALVHSSTLVTAGVFLLIRFFPSLNKLSLFKPLILMTASLTMLMAGLSAMAENDMKKIIALSTLSQLGVMMASLGLNLPNLALFHLLTHALFKALLFICAGALISHFKHSQDLRSFGNLTSQFPRLLSFMTVANMALVGTPFLAAFYSKDMILEMATASTTNALILALLFISTSLTSAYSLRFLFATTWAPSLALPLAKADDLHPSVKEAGTRLSLATITGGALISWTMFPTNPEPLIPLPMKTLALLMTLLGAALSWSLSNSFSSAKNHIYALTAPEFSAEMWFMTPLSSQLLLGPPLLESHKLLKLMDQGWNESMGGQGLHTMSSSLTQTLQLWQHNIITSHLSLMMFSLIPLTLLLILP